MKWFRRIRELAHRAQLREIGVYAAYASYFIILAIFPAMMLLISLLQYTPVSPSYLREVFGRLVPDSLQTLLDYMIDELFAVNSAAIVSLSAVTSLWMASKGFYAVHQGLTKVYNVRETRSFLQIRLRCVGFTLLFFFLLLFAGTLQLLGKDFLTSIGAKATPLGEALLRLVRIKYLLSLTVLTLSFAGLYCIFPNRKVRFADALPGAFAAAVLWILFSRLFTLYVEHFGNYSLYYGSLSVMAIAMLWLYACMFILFCGGVLNCQLEHRRQRKQRLETPEQP